jgi:enoyl-CoA hydratase
VSGQSSILEFEDGALFMTERPSKLNAITGQILQDLEKCLDTLLERKARFLVISGRGSRAFSAGTDLSELQARSHEDQVEKCGKARNLLVRLSQAPIVSVAAVNGLALGGGLELAMACTLRIATPTAEFSLPEIQLGLLPAYAGTQMLPAIVGHARALEIMLTGRRFPAREALAIGLIHRITEDHEPIVDAAFRFARSVTCHSSEAVQAIRACVAASCGVLSASGLQTEDGFVRALFDSPVARERLAAFHGKRAADLAKKRSGG